MVLNSSADPALQPLAPELVEHTKRLEWGKGLLAWDRGNKRAYQFADGKLRVFKRGFFHLLSEVFLDPDEMKRITKPLRKALGITSARRELMQNARLEGTKVVTLQEQLAWFEREYPGGFANADWAKILRGTGVKRRLKRHRDAAIADARAAWQRKTLDQLLAEKKHSAIWKSYLDVMKNTDLVQASRVQALRDLKPAERKAAALALRELLHGEASLVDRVNGFVEALGAERLTWAMVTAPLMLLYPEDHVCVSPASFRRQARWMAPQLQLASIPSGRQYQRWRAMTLALRDRLVQAKLGLRDLVDVYDFIRLSLSPSATGAQ